MKVIGKKRVNHKAAPKMTATIKSLSEAYHNTYDANRPILHNANTPKEMKQQAIEANKAAKTRLQRAQRQELKAHELNTFSQLCDTQKCSKSFWSRIKRLRASFKNDKSPPPMVDRPDGTLATDHREILNIWKNHIQEQAQGKPEDDDKYDSSFKMRTSITLRIKQAIRLHQEELDEKITRNEVWEAIRHMKMGKAAGEDQISADIVRAAAGAVWNSKLHENNPTVDAMTLLFNYIYDKEVWPTRWSQGVIIPLHKHDSMTDPSNYRPITLLSIIQKLFGYIINQRLMTWTENHNTISESQGGFRWQRSTIDQVLQQLEILKMRKAQNLETYVSFIDVRKAYDTVWREANFVRIHDMGINGKIWRQLQKMYQALNCKVRLPIGETEWVKFHLGTAQGAVESPWLFNCFINGLSRRT